MKIKRTLLFIVLLIAIAATIIVLVVPFSRFGKMCRYDDENVRQTAEAFQNYYREMGTFPKVSDTGQMSDQSTTSLVFLEGIKKLYYAGMFSSDNPGEMFVYFNSNCKLKITPDSHDVYPR